MIISPTIAPLRAVSNAARIFQESEILRLADRLAPKLRRAFLQAVAGLKEQVAIRRLEAALSVGDIDAALRLLPFTTFETEIGSTLKREITTIFARAGDEALNALPKAIKSNLRFDLLNPRAVEWINRHSLKLVSGITEESREAIREILRRSFVDGFDSRSAARMMRQHLGLNQRQSTALYNYHRQLALDGRLPADVERLVSRYQSRLLNHRARTIVRHESIEASNAGQVELWRQGQDAGYIARAQKVVIVTRDERLCKICAPMDGEKRDIEQPFSTGRMNPPFHVTCRCTMGLEYN